MTWCICLMILRQLQDLEMCGPTCIGFSLIIGLLLEQTILHLGQHFPSSGWLFWIVLFVCGCANKCHNRKLCVEERL